MKLSPREKAKELIESFSSYVDSEIAGEKRFEFSREKKILNQKECALKVWDEITYVLNEMREEGNEHPLMEEYWYNVGSSIRAFPIN